MSYDYFLQAFEHQEEEEVSTGKVLEVLNPYITRKGDGVVDLEFDDFNQCSVYLDLDEAVVSGMMINRPCQAGLGECIYRIMRLGNFVFFEPDGKHMIVVDPAVEAHLPEDMIEGLGKPVVGVDLVGFLALYESNRD